MASVERWLILIGIVASLVTTVIGFIMTTRRVQDVHVLVNKQLSDVLARVAQLTDTLHGAGVPVPPVKAGSEVRPVLETDTKSDTQPDTPTR